ncbi:helix-turn-helix domain-containing protein [Enterobacteriaceae bacterium H11S18]|uniref:helix-turn-helix domain-containing protein n=1 Tax=Dryocola clanedunensis TaxID=2925396 RepID=UPI0022F0C73B|nr:helix-turn-helix domain-containing protein [Dryocola clanedunensis]MCT4706579.1 helix-turn-helix domain-containing protein [Dryocola clanedunensis]MCT4713391.1 helix-turn-helix domain-containing protein [Dryocola clanedunensis]
MPGKNIATLKKIDSYFIDSCQLNDLLSFMDKGVCISYKAGTSITLSSNEILICVSGEILISPNIEGGCALGHAFEYMPIGLIERYNSAVPLRYDVQKEARVISLSYEDFDEAIHASSIGSLYLNKVMAYMISALVYINHERNAGERYYTIRSLLYRYQYLYAGEVKSAESVSAFILKRTGLSRSYVFQILSGLRDGGYITINKGKMLSINKTIPVKY